MTKKPRFTDQHRYPKGYRTAAATDIRATFKRIQAEQKANAAEVAQKVEPLNQRRKVSK